MNEPKDVLVFFSYRNHKFGYIEMLFKRLVEIAQVKQPNLKLHRGSLNDLHIQIKDNSLSITETLTGRELDSFGMVYFELWYKAQQQALAAARLLEQKGVPYFSKEINYILPMTKIGELSVLANNNIPLPNTFISSRREVKKAFKKNPPLTFPIIVKAADGYGGKDNYLVSDYAKLVEILDENKHLQFVIQEFIPNDRDYRCLVIGGEIKLVLMRSRDQSKNTHLNNTSAGAEGKVVPIDTLPISARDAVLNAAKVLNRFEFAGADLMFNKDTGEPYILEVNQTPQIEIGAEVDKKMNVLLEYINEKVRG